MDFYTELANAIVIQAAKDYRKALKTLKRYPRYEPAKAVVAEVEEFFRSDWYRMLTSVDAEMLMRKIRREINDCA
ncbi:MAG: hypothetical protein IJW79_02040 [Clostridia bacterium]|jgi:hypothetical protein|nr:hypothetical protein [Clostridia bacterium]MBQ9750747.1 hypothetical protein [Clostridia bacterium]